MTGANILQDGLRSVLWLFCQFALWLMDLCYSVINDLATLDLGDFQFIWSWFRGVSALLFFFLTDDGDLIEFGVPNSLDFDFYNEGDTGVLTYQGTRMLKFERTHVNIDNA